jgi:hypothetical protein
MPHKMQLRNFVSHSTVLPLSESHDETRVFRVFIIALADICGMNGYEDALCCVVRCKAVPFETLCMLSQVSSKLRRMSFVPVNAILAEHYEGRYSRRSRRREGVVDEYLTLYADRTFTYKGQFANRAKRDQFLVPVHTVVATGFWIIQHQQCDPIQPQRYPLFEEHIQLGCSVRDWEPSPHYGLPPVPGISSIISLRGSATLSSSTPNKSEEGDTFAIETKKVECVGLNLKMRTFDYHRPL